MPGELLVIVASSTLSVVATLFAGAILLKRKALLTVGFKRAFVVLFVLGFSMSLLAGFRDYPGGDFSGMLPLFLYPLMLLGLFDFALLGTTVAKGKLHLVSEYHAFVLLSGTIALQWLISHINLLVTFLGA
jgi:hypothetical protein